MLKYEDVTGKYLHLEVDGLNYRIYIEESGCGIPLLLQHTAGSDGRLWGIFSTMKKSLEAFG